MPTITQIPEAATLQMQLDLLLKAVEALGVDGTTVPNVTIAPGPPTDISVPSPFYMAIGLSLTPPISDAATLAELGTALYAQAEAIQQQLVDMGYNDDVTQDTLTNYKREHNL